MSIALIDLLASGIPDDQGTECSLKRFAEDDRDFVRCCRNGATGWGHSALAVQYLRTADTKDILCAFRDDYEKLSEAERTRLHTALLWNLEIVHEIRDRIKKSIWVFGRNETDTPFVTSDNPVAFRTPDNRQWRKVGILGEGMYVVHPLSPGIVMYCYDRSPPWDSTIKFDSCLSPVVFNTGMVESENSGQVFMASRFVFAPRDDFEHERQFARSIGTDLYAQEALVPKGEAAN